MGTILPTTLDHELFQLDSNRETVPTTASRFVIYIHPSKKPFLLDKGSYRNTLGQCYSMCSKRDPVGLGKEKKKASVHYQCHLCFSARRWVGGSSGGRATTCAETGFERKPRRSEPRAEGGRGWHGVCTGPHGQRDPLWHRAGGKGGRPTETGQQLPGPRATPQGL